MIKVPPRKAESGGKPKDQPKPGKELTAADVAERAAAHLASLTSREVSGVTSIEPVEDGWVVEVEVLEQRRVPSSVDMMALYEIGLDVEGELLSYRRTSRYARNQQQTGNGVT